MVAVALEQAVDAAGAAAAGRGFDREDSSVSRQAVTVDEQGFSELSQAIARLNEEVAAHPRAQQQRASTRRATSTPCRPGS